jgi:hypothetical protein
MFVRLITIGILTFLFCSCRLERDMRRKVQVSDRTTESVYELKRSDYSNGKILKGIKGKLYVLNRIENNEYVMIKWDNGYEAFGLLRNEKEYGKWYLYDSKNRLREVFIYSEDGSFLILWEVFNKQGKTIRFSPVSTPPF